jgi:hypothetical protein
MFSKTKTLTQFAKDNNITSVELIRNPNNDKRFIMCSDGTTMRLSEKVDDSLSGDLSVSWFAPEDGEASWMIHPTGTSNVLAKLTFNFGAVADKAPAFTDMETSI